MNLLRRLFQDLILDNFLFKLLSFVFAALVWFWVQSENVVDQRVRVAVEWKLPEGMMLTERPVETATATIEGAQAMLRGLRQRELRLQVDLSQAGEGEVAVDLNERPITGLPAQARVVSLAPSDFRVTLDRTLKRRLDVAAAVVGDVAPGYRVLKSTVEPDRVEVIGPATLVRTLARVTTEEVDVSALKETAEFDDVGLALPRGTVRPLGVGRVKVTVSIEAIREKRRMDDVLIVVLPEGRYRAKAESASVDLEGPISALRTLDPATVNIVVHIPEDFRARQGVARAVERGLRYEIVHASDPQIVGRVVGTGIAIEAVP